MKFLGVVMILLATSLPESSGDPCNINDDEICASAYNNTIVDPRRSTAIAVVPMASTGDSYVCDHALAKQWYRFKGTGIGQNLQIPERCIETYHCGTQTPLWLNGTHPINSQVADRVVCANYGVAGDCCSHTIGIRVKKCIDNRGDDFYAYCLSPTDGCDQAYCAGNQVPCHGDQVWSSAYGHCVDAVPEMNENPILHPPVIDLIAWTVTFTCEIRYRNDTDDGARFAVKFLFDYVEFQEVNDATQSPLDPTKKTVELDAKYLGANRDMDGGLIWSSKMGKTVSCVVKTYWQGWENQTSREFHSNGYYAGIRANKTYMELSEGGDGDTLSLYSTVPFLCDTQKYDHCYIDIDIQVENEVSPSECKIQLFSKSWDPETHKAEAPGLHVYATEDGQIDGDQVSALTFRKTPFGRYYHHLLGEFIPKTFSEYQPESIQVRTKDEGPTGHCKGVTDPHYTTFDGTRFTILMLGEFYLYLSTIRRFEVQVRTWYCYGAHRYDVTCHCAVAVREGNNVVIIDLCHVGWGNHENAYPRIIEKTADGGPLSEAVSVYRDQTDKKFSIHMESTATVVVEINRYGMDVHVYAPARDRGHTTGLCGTWDDQPDRSNDLQLPSGSFTTDVDTFANSWKIDQGTSLFDVDCPDVDPHAQRPVKTCTCQNGSIQCGFGQNTRRNTIRGLNTRTTIQKSSRNLNCRNRTQGSTRSTQDNTFYSDDIDESEGYVFDYGENQPPPPVVQWPTANLHITEEDAVRHCREAIINSSVSAACANLGVDIFDPVDACVQDIKLTEDLLIAAAHVDTMKATCTDVAYQNISLYEVGEDGIPVPSRAVQDNLCPEDCNHRGDCVKGTCVCLEPYTSADCSLEKGNTPVIRSIPNNGLCDIRRRPCRKTSIIADGLDSSNVTCKIVDVKTENGIQTIIQGSERLMNATIRTFLEASCPLPESPVLRGTPDETEGTDIYGYSVSVSNDGENFSNEVLFTIYDSVCQNCTLGPTCFWKLNTCKIRGFCFADGDPNPNNWCQQCLPQLSSNTFTDRPINIPPTIVSPTTITKVRGNHLDFAVITDDPEGRTVTVSIISANSNDITVNGDQFEWRTDQEVGSFVETFKASDECGAFSTHNVTFITIACPCQNNGTCVHNPNMTSGQGQYVCECPGFTGHLCEQEIDECLSNPCHTGTCIDLVNGFKCLCDGRHVGEFCHIDQGDNCALEPCFHSVPCINVGSGFECGDCPEGFTGNGIICEDVDECATNTTNDCSNICENTPGSYRCTCPSGFIESNDQCFDLDECDYGLSECSHTCINTNGSYICACPVGYSLGPDGKNCIDINECTAGTDNCHAHATCINTDSSFICSCNDGYVGNGVTCTDTNGCDPDPCVAVATCTDIPAPGTGAICTCQAGYQGDGKIHSSGCTDIPGCDPNPCVTTAFCVDVSAPGTGAECICPDGYEGDGALGGIGCKAVPATSQMWEPWKIALLCVGLLGAVFVTISLSLYLCCRCKKNPLCKSATNEDEMPIKGFENPTSHRTNHGMDLEVSEC